MKQHLRIQRTAAILLLAMLVLATFSTPASAQITLFDKYYAVPNPGKLPDCSKANPCSLQAAVNKAGDDDTIYVKGGSVPYTSTESQVVYINKSVVIRGGWDGSALGRFDHVDPVTYPTVLDGEDARRVILIEGDASPTLRGLIIQGGFASGGNGGGINILNPTTGSVTIEGCRIQGNTAGSFGGGININKGTLTVKDSLISGNNAQYGGGAILAAIGTNVTLINNEFSSNTADYGSVGHFDRASLVAQNNNVYENDGDSFTLNAWAGQTIQFENNVIANNLGSAVTIYTIDPSTISFLHNTLSNNTKHGLEVGAKSSGVIANNIFNGQSQQSIFLVTGSTVTISHNLFWLNGSDPNTGSNSQLQDPKLDVTFHLLFGSPAINAGTASGVIKDMDGQLRPLGLPDIGADEFSLPLYIPTTMR